MDNRFNSHRDLALSAFNTFEIFFLHNQTVENLQTIQNQRNKDLHNLNSALNQTNSNMQTMHDLLNGKIDDVNARLPIGQYDCVIYRVWNYNDNQSYYLAKNGKTGSVDLNSTNAAYVFNEAFLKFNSVYVKADDYNLTQNVYLTNKKNARLDSDGATLFMYGNKLVVSGKSFEYSENNQVSGLVVVDGTLRVQNSFRTTITNMIFENCTVGVELANTNTWTEATRLDTIHFDKCVQGLVFRTNTSDLQNNSTGSYGNTAVTRCYFNQLDNSVAITVEKNAEFTDSRLSDVRIWIGEFGRFNQTGLLLYGSMYEAVMDGVVFESFATGSLDDALIYGMRIGQGSFQAPDLNSGVNFLGNWSARIYNPEGWLYGTGGVFKLDNITIPLGLGDYGEVKPIEIHPATIAAFTPKITVQGSFQNNETVTVRFRLDFIDNTVSPSVEKTFTGNGSVWLDNDDFLQLYCRPELIYSILVDAKASNATDAWVRVDVYGTMT
jgi:hypothetical protein